MPGGALELRSGGRPETDLFALIFGNEASGLDPDFCEIGTSVSIPQPGPVDSFNLAVAAAIGMYAFSM
jgi:TrmH family RNA methyltransferase